MKKYLVALTVFAAGLVVADYFFGVNVMELVDGFWQFLVDIFKGPGS